METLRLDSDIRNWVLIPITVAMFLVGVLRHNFAKLLRSDAKVDLKALREAQAVIRAERIRNNAGYMQAAGFRQRRFFFCDKVSERRTSYIHIRPSFHLPLQSPRDSSFSSASLKLSVDESATIEILKCFFLVLVFVSDPHTTVPFVCNVMHGPARAACVLRRHAFYA